MKREDLKAIEGLSDEAIDKIMALHGQDVNTLKSTNTDLQSQLDATRQQLTDANTQIEGFKGMKKPEEVDAAVNEWKTKFNEATKNHAAELSKIKQDKALEDALKDKYGVSDAVAVRAHLKMDNLKFNDAEGVFVGLDEQMKAIKESHSAYFNDYTPPPTLVKGTGAVQNTKSLTMEQVKSMSPDEVNKNWEAVQAALSSKK